MSVAFELLQNGSFFTGVSTMYDGVLGAWWKIFILMFILAGTMIVTKSEGATGAIGIVCSAFLSYHLGSAVPIWIHGILYLIIALCIALLFFRFAGKGE